MKWSDRYIHFQNIYGLGEGQLGFIKNIINFQGVLTILNFVMLYFPEYADSALTIAPIGVASYIIIGYFTGSYLDKKLKMVDKNKSWTNERDPAIQEILLRLRKLDRQRAK